MCWEGWRQDGGSVSDHSVAWSWLFVGAADGHGCGLQGRIGCGERQCRWAAGGAVRCVDVLEGLIWWAGAQLGLDQRQDGSTQSTGVAEGRAARLDSWVDWQSCWGGLLGDWMALVSRSCRFGRPITHSPAAAAAARRRLPAALCGQFFRLGPED